MIQYIVRRAVRFLLTFYIISLVVFLGMRLAPGDPALAIAPEAAAPGQIDAIRHELGLDKSLWAQYTSYISGLLHGNLGTSYTNRVPVARLLVRAIPMSALLAGVAWGLSSFIGIMLGILGALNRGSVLDLVIIGVAGAGRGLPDFWLGIMLILIFSVRLGLFPPMGSGSVRHIILPATALAVQIVSLTLRITRDQFLEVLSMDFVRTAEAKGLKKSAVLWRHVFRNAAIPIVTVLGLRLAALLGAGMVITESVFNWPGLGNLLISAIRHHDYPTVQACMFVVAVAFLAINLVVDLLYAALDPRIRYQ